MTAAVNAPAGDSEAAAGRGRAWLPVIAVLLVLDGLITVVLEVLYLPLYAGRGTLAEASGPLMAEPLAAATTTGAVPVPIAALVAAVVNVLLVMGMGTISQRPAVMLLPLLAWTLGFLLLASTGPGGDVMLIGDWPTMLLFLCGLVPAGLYLYWRVTARAVARAV
ncbi:hypothetical protein [Nocardia huaxiensis]|uniref:Uncharacterized protein n=1 Tax=Nocardia huaxiensis TaxID=2755382 RepID=A0A7D6ZSF1_9NOCA|nr:hypothetical protein [Nocardia huaxiensis]QLY32765.1 hypothetical protein H0264_11370 [Nocardia huaxiensis]UFS93500.1 hypothetical protein LPY97_22005 [Nocardia huaxiensis]